MKHLLFSLCFVAAAQFQLAAQSCTPLSVFPDSIIAFPRPYLPELPGSGIPDTACVGMYYETALHLKVPSQIESPFGTIAVNSINMATDGGMLNLPASMDYVCNPPNCIFPKDSIGCILLYGTPSPGEEGVYDVKASVVVKSIFDIPLTIPDGTIIQGNYFLHVKPEGDPACQLSAIVSEKSGELNIYNSPNPFSTYTEFFISTRQEGNFQLGIRNILGATVYSESIHLQNGDNIIPVHMESVPEGVYFYVLTNGNFGVSGKVVVGE